jgi:mRNA interferase MazF
MTKDFDLWNNDKKKIDQTNRIFYFNEREVWWCSLGVNVGFEVDGKNQNFVRPILVLKTFGNKTCWVLPMTSVKNKILITMNAQYWEKQKNHI